MNPQDYGVMLHKIAENFIKARLKNDSLAARLALLNQMIQSPAEVGFHGFMVSVFHGYRRPEECAGIISASESQNIDAESWNGLPPREAIFAMAFELLKTDVWNTVSDLLGKPSEEQAENDQQLTMFGAA